MDNNKDKSSNKDNEKKTIQEVENRNRPQKLLPITIVLIVFGFLWFGINLWEIIIENNLNLGKIKRLSDTFYWGENYEIEVRWKWFRSEIKNNKETHSEVDETLCFISGTINNKSDKILQINSITLILQTADEINLYEIYGYLDLLIMPKEQETLEISEYIETSLVLHFKTIGGLLAYNFIEGEGF